MKAAEPAGTSRPLRSAPIAADRAPGSAENEDILEFLGLVESFRRIASLLAIGATAPARRKPPL